VQAHQELEEAKAEAEVLRRTADKCWVRPYLIEDVYHLFLESQFPHKIVNLILTLVIVNNKLTIL
jgi:hypothetical protein